MTWFECPYVNAAVELTDERWAHVRTQHRYFRPEDRDVIAAVLAHPGEIRRRVMDLDELLFVRSFESGERPICVVVTRIDDGERWWVVTAYRTDVEVGTGDVVWSDDEA